MHDTNNNNAFTYRSVVDIQFGYWKVSYVFAYIWPDSSEFGVLGEENTNPIHIFQRFSSHCLIVLRDEFINRV